MSRSRYQQWDWDDGWDCEACPERNNPRRKTCANCTAYRVDNIDIDALEIPACLGCGNTCGSQLEFIQSNKAKPWPYCSGCDPGLCEGDDDCPCVTCRELREAA